jgi:hypothetical protein
MERQVKIILQLTGELEAAKEEYEKLQMELKEQEKDELFEAYSKSKRSFEMV